MTFVAIKIITFLLHAFALGKLGKNNQGATGRDPASSNNNKIQVTRICKP